MTAPLTPPDCNLRGFPWMALDTVRLLDSDLFLLATGDEFKAALALWCKSWSQVPAASLPNDERLLAGLSGAKNWKKVRDMALRGWVLCTDGRWYHPVVAEKALEALPAMKAHADQKAASKERKVRERADRARMFEVLREHGIVPDYNTSTAKLRELAAPHMQPVTPPVTRDTSQHDTANTKEDRTGQERTGEDSTSPINSAPIGAGVPPPVAEPMTVLEAVAVMDRVDGQPLLEEQEKLLWAGGRAIFKKAGVDGEAAGKFIGKLIKDNGGDRVLVFDVMRAACLEGPVDPRGWMTATCQQRRGQRVATTNKQTALEDGNLAAAAAFSGT